MGDAVRYWLGREELIPAPGGRCLPAGQADAGRGMTVCRWVGRIGHNRRRAQKVAAPFRSGHFLFRAAGRSLVLRGVPQVQLDIAAPEIVVHVPEPLHGILLANVDRGEAPVHRLQLFFTGGEERQAVDGLVGLSHLQIPLLLNLPMRHSESVPCPQSGHRLL